MRFFTTLMMVLAVSVLIGGGILAPAAVFADDEGHPPLTVLTEKIKKAMADGDVEAANKLEGQIFEHVTGLSATNADKPEGMTDEVFHKKLCAFERAMIKNVGVDTIILNMAVAAYGHVYEGWGLDEYPIFQRNCDYQGLLGKTKEQLKTEVVFWTKKISNASPNEVRSGLKKYRVLYEQDPGNAIYALRKHVISLRETDIKIRDLKEGLGELSRWYRKTLSEGLIYQTGLVDKADKGDLPTQLEVARRLEVGDKFRQDNASAYFWYQRASQNGGGEPAQVGMDRLRPLLRPMDWDFIQIWMKDDEKPY